MRRGLLTAHGMVLSMAVACSGAGGGKGSPHSDPVDSGRNPVDSGMKDSAVNPAENDVRCPDYQSLRNLYWGDLHAHTSYSLDSYAVANRNDPKDAYAFARGAEVPIAAGDSGPIKAKIDRPLDFLAVTDHSEFFDIVGECILGAAGNTDSPYCRAIRDQGSQAQTAAEALAGTEIVRVNPQPPPICRGTPSRIADCETAARTAWQKTQQAATAANVACSFTSLVAYEWTATTASANLHRNVIFGSSVVPEAPFDYVKYPTPLKLWRALDASCKSVSGCDAITIPHNANASYGRMWETIDTREAIPYMERYQVLTEIFQHKGNSECLPGDALSDPNCDFEIIPGSFLGTAFGIGLGSPNSDSVVAGPQGYVRPGLARGLTYAASHGDNPLQMGFVGATDTHNGTPGNVKEEGWVGHLADSDNTPEKRLGKSPFNPGGITGVWAPQNTRKEIFAALKRRETYATSGPRITLRVYAAPGIADDKAAQALCDDPSFPKALVDAGGKPMGAAVQGAGKPYLFAFAMKDNDNLAKIDFVKLSTGPDGKVNVLVQPFALSGPAQSKACVFWSDPAYVPENQTLYYARVFQEPTWRWSHYDCAARPGTAGCDATDLDAKVSERAWSSPIFFKP